MLSEEIKKKRLVMSPEMYCHEMSLCLTEMYLAFRDQPPMSREVALRVFREAAEGHVNLIWQQNINSKPTDPEKIQ